MDLMKKIKESVEVLKKQMKLAPEILVVLGSGYRKILDTLTVTVDIPFSQVPHFCEPKVKGHGTRLIATEIAGKSVVFLSGRLHLYEGHSPADVVHPIRVFGYWGCKRLILTNASGSLDESVHPGELVCIKDQINFTGQNPLVGAPQDLGPQFVDTSRIYDPEWIKRMRAADPRIQEGVYAGVLGPNYETRAECHFFRQAGCKIVGMSTVCEALAATHMGYQTLGLSYVTNDTCGVDRRSQPTAKLDHKDVVAASEKDAAYLIETIRKAISLSTP